MPARNTPVGARSAMISGDIGGHTPPTKSVSS
jgi:hypothetical protein